MSTFTSTTGQTDQNHSDLQFRALFENAQDCIYVYRLLPTRGFEYVSPSAQAIFGYTPAEFCQDPDLVLKISHPKDRARLQEDWQHVEQFPRRVVRRWIHRDGRIIWTENLNTPIRDPEGQVVSIHGIGRDITEQKLAEGALSHLAAIVEHSHDAIYRIGLDGTVETWNQGAETLYGYSAAEMIGHSITTVFPPENRHEPAHLLARITTGETIREYRAARLCKEGRVILVSVCWSPIRDGEGNIVAASAIARDATEREQAQRFSRALNEIDEFIHSTLDAEQVMRRVITHAATVLESETAAISLREPDGWTVRYTYGFSDEVIGTRMNDDEEQHAVLAIRTGQIIAIDDALSDERANRAHMLKWNVRSVLIVPLRAGPQVIGVMYFNHHRQPFHFQPAHLDFANKLASSVALALENARLYGELERELADRIRVEREREELLAREHAARAEAEAAVRLRDHFFNVAAHELRNPLTTMMGYSELLAKPGGLENTERAQRGMQTIYQQTARLGKMIDALLDVSRIVEGKFSLERAPFDLSPLITRVVDEFRLTTHKHTLQVTLPDTPLVVNGDELRLEQVVRNLLANAIKYSVRGGPIVVTVECCDNQACLSVADSGIGIPADALPHLFHRFYRAPNAEAHHIPGLGIGLFVIQEIISQHGGTVQVESEEGKGTTFTVRLPLQDRPESELMQAGG